MSYKTWSPSFTSYAQSSATKAMKLENLDPDLEVALFFCRPNHNYSRKELSTGRYDIQSNAH